MPVEPAPATLRRHRGWRPSPALRARLRSDAVPITAAVAVLVVDLRQLLVRPIVALAANGDFDRLLAAIGLRRAPTAPYSLPFAWTHYVVGRSPSPSGFYFTSYLAIAEPMGWLARVLPGARFDSRILATVLAVLLALLVYAVVRSLPAGAPRLAGAAVIAVGLCDSRLVAYLDSWYDEPWSLLLLLGLTAWLLHNGGARAVSPRRLGVLAAMAALLVTAKTQDAVLALPLAAAVAVVAGVRVPGRRSERLLRAVAPALVLVALGGAYLAAQPGRYADESRYDLVFDDLLVHSHDPVATVEALGLPPAMAAYAGTSAYQAGTGFHTPAYARFDRGHPTLRLLGFLAGHPGAAVAALGRGMQAGWRADLPYLGYRTRSSGRPPWSGACEPCAYSDATGAASPLGAPVTIGLYAGALLLAATARRRGAAGQADALVMLCAVSATALVAAVFGEGSYEETKHLYLFYVADLLTLAVAASAAATCRPWGRGPAGRRPAGRRAGVTSLTRRSGRCRR